MELFRRRRRVEGGVPAILRQGLILIFIWALLALAGIGTATAERRVALVIGNGAYAHTSPLANPTNDARDMAVALNDLGFEVTRALDTDRRALQDTVRRFLRDARGAEVGLVFYAGHGLQVGGENFLVPVDARLEVEADIPFDTVNLIDIVRPLERTVKTTLVFLDACRDNPMARSMRTNAGTRSTAVGRGLARVETGVGTLYAFAAAPGEIALDGRGRNSPFTAALVEHIATPGLEIRQVLSRVRNDVLRATNDRQKPWDHSSLRDDVYLLAALPESDAVAEAEVPPEPDPADEIAAEPPPAPAPAPAPAPTPLDPATLAWDTILLLEGAAKRRALLAFLERFPDSPQAPSAEILLVALSDGAPPPVADGDADVDVAEVEVAAVPTAPVVPEVPPEPTPADLEAALNLSQSDRRSVQEALTRLGFDTRAVDGLLGPNSRRAIRSWQQNRGDEATGYLQADQVAWLVRELEHQRELAAVAAVAAAAQPPAEAEPQPQAESEFTPARPVTPDRARFEVVLENDQTPTAQPSPSELDVQAPNVSVRGTNSATSNRGTLNELISAEIYNIFGFDAPSIIEGSGEYLLTPRVRDLPRSECRRLVDSLHGVCASTGGDLIRNVICSCLKDTDQGETCTLVPDQDRYCAF